MFFQILTLAAGEAAGRFDLAGRLQQMLQQPHTGLILRAFFLLVSGGVGIYLLLPRGQRPGSRTDRYVGGALTTLALVLLATIPISADPAEGLSVGAGEAVLSPVAGSERTILWPLDGQPEAACYVFHALAFVSLASAVMMITSRSPVYSALWFAMVLLGNSGLYLLQGAEFLSAATIIVYAGAIVVTFLFVIMLAQPNGAARYDRVSREPFLSSLTGLVLASTLLGTLHHAARLELRGGTTESAVLPAADVIARYSLLPDGRDRIGDYAAEDDPELPPFDHVTGLGKSLFLDHVVSVEVIGVLLLAAVVGAMLIAGHPVEPRRGSIATASKDGKSHE